eukprot:CAMPEP_0179254100 /NCGR_PEP_ID=MMETSP0797-20121207/23071_1 /TAXON_ID=47934 /ORGANISM="Dinophysis acuminata, Strain DAEP01" /LENGTH=46 /DNA_ID= /DNA_START= /DNA_END= /DNA_ORIENTATION=
MGMRVVSFSFTLSSFSGIGALEEVWLASAAGERGRRPAALGARRLE